MKVKFLLMFLLVIGMLTSPIYAGLSFNDCVGMWLFDEGKGDLAIDASESKNDGTLQNGPDWVEGKFNEAIQFDGSDDYVDFVLFK